MANYYGQARTNYFAVKDDEAFVAEMSKLPVEVITEEKDGKTLYGFLDANQDGGGLDSYVYDSETEQEDSIDWIETLQKHVAPGWAVILMEVGHEKYRYLNAYTYVITESGFRELNLEDWAHETARNELGAENVTPASY